MGEPFSCAEEISPGIQSVGTKERQGTKEEEIQPNRNLSTSKEADGVLG